MSSASTVSLALAVSSVSTSSIAPYYTPGYKVISFNSKDWIIWDTFGLPNIIEAGGSFPPRTDLTTTVFEIYGPDRLQNTTMNQTLTSICANTAYDFFMYAGSSGLDGGGAGTFSMQMTVYLDNVEIITSFVPCGTADHTCSIPWSLSVPPLAGYNKYTATSIIPTRTQPTLAVIVKNVAAGLGTPIPSFGLVPGLSFRVR